MMTSRRNFVRAIAYLLVFSIVQLYVPAAVAQQFIARLTSTRGGPVLVNGNTTPVPGSIVTGAEIQTGADQSATIDLGDIGELKIGPNTRLKLDYEQGKTRITLFTGCAVLQTKEKAEGEIEAGQQSAGKTDKRGGLLDVCFIDGKVISNQNAAANAIAGVGATAGAGGGGISTRVLLGVVLASVGGGLLFWAIVHNSSPSSP